MTVRWKDDDILTLISFWEDNYDDYSKDVKQKFYNKLKERLDCEFTSIQIRNKCNELLNKYKNVYSIMSQSGFGCDELDPPTVEKTIKKKFMYFYEMHKIFGMKTHVKPVYVTESSVSDGNVKDVDNPIEGMNTPLKETDNSVNKKDMSSSSSSSTSSSKSSNDTPSKSEMGRYQVKKRKRKDNDIIDVIRDIAKSNLEFQNRKLDIESHQFQKKSLFEKHQYEMQLYNQKMMYELEKAKLEVKIKSLQK